MYVLILYLNHLRVSPLIIFLEDEKNQYKCIYKPENGEILLVDNISTKIDSKFVAMFCFRGY